MLSATDIHRPGRVRCNAVMDVNDSRRENLRNLVRRLTDEQFGGGKGAIKYLAEQLETDPNYISQIIGDRHIRNMNDEMARDIERLYRMPHGWMDYPPHVQRLLSLDEEVQELANRLQEVPTEKRSVFSPLIDSLAEPSRIRVRKLPSSDS